MPALLPLPPWGRRTLILLLVALIVLGGWLSVRYALAEYHLHQGDRASGRGHHADALAAYQAALSHRPASARLHLLAARAARRAGDALLCREHLRRCRELQKGVTEEQQVEALLLRAETGEVDEVSPQLLPYVAQPGPLTPAVLEALVRGHTGMHRAEASWHFLTRWEELEPDNSEVAFRKALWFSQQQNIRGATGAYERALELDPERIDARLAYAEVLKLNRHFEEAAAQCREALRRAPAHPGAQLSLAQCLADLGRNGEAREALRGIPPEARSADGLWVRARVEMQEEDFDAAEKSLREALELDPHHHDATYNRMLCLRRLGREGEAAEAERRFLAIDRDHKRLIALTSTEMTARPLDPALHCELGELYLRLGMPRRGLRWLNSALRVSPGYRRAHEHLRGYYEALGPEGREQAEYHRQQLAAR